MKKDIQIDIHHLTRVEGHGDIHADIVGGKVQSLCFAIVEAPRFFEALVRGRMYPEVVHIASRICGICAVSHRGAAVKATESAFGVAISPQTETLRRLAFYGEMASSHILHVYFLALPDFMGADSLFDLAGRNQGLVRRAMRLKKLAYEISATVVGRHTHPPAMQVGGFTFVHQAKDLKKLRDRLANGLQDLMDTVRSFQSLQLPQLERRIRHVCLKNDRHYAFYEGDLYDGEDYLWPRAYGQAIAETAVPYSTAKYSRWKGEIYQVGALARFNHNFDQLTPSAREAADKLGLKPPVRNPFANTWAQIVECCHCFEDGIRLIDRLLETGIDPESETAPVTPKAGQGVGVVEAPRGLLIHEYEYDDTGQCLFANMIIPTAQNLSPIEADMRQYAAAVAAGETTPRQKLAHGLEMVARAYDPCISCAAH